MPSMSTPVRTRRQTPGKNGIAVCEILLTEGIVADLFSNHKVLGELILIDRVTNMTSACGVVDAVSERSAALPTAILSSTATSRQEATSSRNSTMIPRA